MKFGITTRSYYGLLSSEAAEEMQKLGFNVTELCFSQSDLSGWAYNGLTEIADKTEDSVLQACREYTSRKIEVYALGLFTKLIGKEEDSEALLERAERMIDIASYCGIPTVASECGFHDDRGLYARLYEEDFANLKRNVARLAKYAAPKGVSIAIEPCVLDVLPSAKRTADFISQLEAEYGVTNVGVLLDYANLLANSTIEEVFYHLKDKILYFHGKDRCVNDAYGKMLGDGEINWKRFFELYKEHTPNVPFILEYPNKDTAPIARDRVLEALG